MRLQTQPKPVPGQSLLYTGTFDCFKKTIVKEVGKSGAMGKRGWGRVEAGSEMTTWGVHAVLCVNLIFRISICSML